MLLLLWRPPEASRLRQLVFAFGLVLATAYATYAAFPVYLERPVLTQDSLATWLLAIEYLDPSYNHFPSLHVALGCLVFFALRDRLGRLRAPLATLLAGMCLSTLFVKQHYLLDVLYGSGLAWAAWAVAFHLRPRRIEGGVFHAAIPFRKALR